MERSRRRSIAWAACLVLLSSLIAMQALYEHMMLRSGALALCQVPAASGQRRRQRGDAAGLGPEAPVRKPNTSELHEGANQAPLAPLSAGERKP